MYLTDKLSAPTKCRIPCDYRGATIIPSGGYLLTWADNDTADFGLHANFKLSADGEEITLFNINDSTLIDSIAFGEQTADISYGRYPDATDNWRFLAAQTPAAENNGAYLGEVSAPKFSHKRGFYTGSFYVTLATETKDAPIYYTLDAVSSLIISMSFCRGICPSNTRRSGTIRGNHHDRTLPSPQKPNGNGRTRPRLFTAGERHLSLPP